MKESNPVEQRIEALADKWKDAVELKKGRVIRIHCTAEELDMTDTFFWYMLALDSLVDDVAFILDPFFSEKETYSQELLQMLDETLTEWNETEKNENINYVPVEWKVDYNIGDKDNEAALFVRNFNNLANSLDLEQERYAVATLPFYHSGNGKNVAKWLEDAIEAGIKPNVRYLVVDTVENPIFEKLSNNYPSEIITVIPEFDLSNMMKQVASMGDPADPSTPYRISFMNMMEEIKNDNEKKAIKAGENCIRIATENAHNNPHWLVQVVVVNIALSNEQLKYKNYDNALKRADMAIAATETLPELLGGGIGDSVAAQAQMNRAAVHCSFGKWKHALNDYEKAAESYKSASNPVMAVEAFRMAAFCAKKTWEKEPLPYLLAGFHIASGVDLQAIKASTFPILVKQLMQENYKDKITFEEIEQVVQPILGDNWQEIIDNILKMPQTENTEITA